MEYYLAIDGGTTNTRISLLRDTQVEETYPIHLGATAGLTDKSQLKQSIKSTIKDVLVKHELKDSQIRYILATGMITSEGGIYEGKYIALPAGLEELHNAMELVRLPEITDIPFVFISGLKADDTSLMYADIMRGEETELMGLSQMDKKEKIFVLPGSHSKVIITNEKGQISSFSTMLTGEMIAALAENTILKNTVDLSVKGLDCGFLLKGYEYCGRMGMNQALFKVRILKKVYACTPIQIYSFYMGTILYNEVMQIKKLPQKEVVIAGREEIKTALARLLQEATDKIITCVSRQEAQGAVPRGLIKIFKYGEEQTHEL